MKKKIPAFETDKEAQDFADSANLTEFDLSGGSPVQFEFEPRSAHVNMRVPKPLLDAVKERAKVRGIPYPLAIHQLSGKLMTYQIKHYQHER
jgi:predicted DNA binding CopG/RHH family protein